MQYQYIQVPVAHFLIKVDTKIHTKMKAVFCRNFERVINNSAFYGLNGHARLILLIFSDKVKELYQVFLFQFLGIIRSRVKLVQHCFISAKVIKNGIPTFWKNVFFIVCVHNIVLIKD